MKKILSLVLVVAMLAAVCTVVVSAEGLANEELFYSNINGRNYVDVGDVDRNIKIELAQYFLATKPFYEYSAFCASWYDSIGNLTCTLYVWQGDYEKTVATEPIWQKELVNVIDNSWAGVTADSGEYFTEGEYLVTYSNPTQRVGIWTSNASNPDTDMVQQTYKDGEYVGYLLESRILKYEGVEKARDDANIVMKLGKNKAYVKGQAKFLSTAPTMINGTPYIPIQVVAENIGANVEYSSEDRALAIEYEDITVTIREGLNKIYANGKAMYLKTAPVILNGVTLVPMEVAEILGMQVKYFASGIVVIGSCAKIFSEGRAAAFNNVF